MSPLLPGCSADPPLEREQHSRHWTAPRPALPGHTTTLQATSQQQIIGIARNPKINSLHSQQDQQASAGDVITFSLVVNSHCC